MSYVFDMAVEKYVNLFPASYLGEKNEIMKKLSFLVFLGLILCSVSLFANGVAIKNASNSNYLRLLSSDVKVTIYDQISIVVTTQKFLNTSGEDAVIKYAFPLPENANGTGLRWNLGNQWYSAVISPTPQDTTLPGGGEENLELKEYLGNTPLFFNLEDTIPNDSILYIELTYVQLLPYEFYEVSFNYPNNYTLIQLDYIDHQHLEFTLESQRAITNISTMDFIADSLFFDESSAYIGFDLYESVADFNYRVNYELSPEDLGLFSYSTLITDTLFDCDDFGNGFFSFIVEPDPESEVIDKVFTLVIDRSGSMSGNKIIQAKEAATYMVDHLNEGDQFNIVDFSNEASSLFEDHVIYDGSTQNSAFNYINAIDANGGTNISAAFSTAIPDFASSNNDRANIIIFLTDGEATDGLTGTDQILNHIDDLINYNEIDNLQIHTFGIGSNTNESLLSQIASQNNGLSEFLKNDELEDVITGFYRKIRNPVLINTQMTVDPPVLVQMYPNPLDNLYLGQQLIVSGRYTEATAINVSFSGEAFGLPQTYSYEINLADSTIPTHQFLTKIWAKSKMDNLFVLYHTYDPDSNTAEEIKDEIIDISMCYNVMSPFTSYTNGTLLNMEENSEMFENEDMHPLAYPNPFIDKTTIKFKVFDNYEGIAAMNLYDIYGRLITTLTIQINNKGEYVFMWSGENKTGIEVPAGMYYYTIQYSNIVFNGEILKL